MALAPFSWRRAIQETCICGVQMAVGLKKLKLKLREAPGRKMPSGKAGQADGRLEWG
jgi:hypothetical protein